MPLLGAHLSIAGGYHQALVLAQKYDCEAVQLFVSQPKAWPVKLDSAGQSAPRLGKLSTENSNCWRARALTKEEIELFRDLVPQTRVRILLAHDSYLINLASPDEELYRQSIEAFLVEVQRAELLGLDYLVTHPGCPVGSGEEAGLSRVVRALDEVHRRCPGYRVRVLLEITAGQGSSLGRRFEHLASILNQVAEPDRLGVCFDTCHAFAAGYSLAPKKAYLATLREFDRVIGLERLKAFHLNDSAKPLGSRVDRHAHVGQGCLGLEPFRLLLGDRRFRRHPMILETPKESAEGDDMDVVNFATLRRLLAKG